LYLKKGVEYFALLVPFKYTQVLKKIKR